MFSTLRAKLITLYSLIIGAISLFVNFYFPSQLEKQSLKAIEEKAHSIAIMVSYGVSPALYFNDSESAAEALRAARQNNDLLFCVVEDSLRQIFVSVEEQKAKENNYYSYVSDSISAENNFIVDIEPIVFNKRNLGKIILALSLEELRANIQSARRAVALVSFLIFLFGVIAIYGISLLLTQPLSRIVETFEDIAAGNFSRRVEVASKDEIGHLSESFNTMVEKVERAQQELQGANRVLEMRVEERTEELRASEERYRKMVEYSPDAIGVHSEGKLIYVNPAAVALFKANNASQLLERSVIDLVHPDYKAKIIDRFRLMNIENKVVPPIPEKLIGVDGTIIDAEVSALPFIYDNKPAIHVVVRDISERLRGEEDRKKLEQQLLAAQKMESIGTLAGGIAHDFNNILAIISGYAQMIEKSAKKINPTITTQAVSIQTVTERGASLVRQLLTFAKKTDTKTELVEINLLVGELVGVLSQTFPKIISIQTELETELPPISADQTQLYQALLNLCVNARDAILAHYERYAGKNLLTIVTKSVNGADLKEKYPSAESGVYIGIAISDTGAGMNETILNRIFEPFFSTKEIGRGSGLGLAVVYGIVNSHKGFVDVQSVLNGGSTFTLYLPAVPEYRASCEIQLQQEFIKAEGNETILLIEDERMLLDINKSILASCGYSVLTATDGEEALQIFSEHTNSIHLVISDLGLPKMDGWQLYQEFKKMKADIKFIIASGFIEKSARGQMLENGVQKIISKPYSAEKLTSMVREILDAKI